jgi:hypothetical protein
MPAGYGSRHDDPVYVREVVDSILNSKVATRWEIKSSLGKSQIKGMSLSSLQLQIRYVTGAHFKSNSQDLKELLTELGYKISVLSHRRQPITVISVRPNSQVLSQKMVDA